MNSSAPALVSAAGRECEDRLSDLAIRRLHLRSDLPEWGILALIVLSPLPQASVLPWSVLAIELAVLFLVAYSILRPGPVPQNEPLAKALKWPRIAALAFFAFVGLQLVPWPLSVLETLAPYAPILHARYALSPAATRFLGLSFVPAETLKAASELLAYVLIGYLVLRTFASIRQFRRLVAVIIAMGVFESLYGIFELYAPAPRILFYAKEAGLDSVTGTFVNRNHFSGYVEMIIPLAIGLIVSRLSLFSLGGLTWRDKLVVMTEKGLLGTVLLAVLTVVMSIAVVFSRSRSGIATMVLTFVFFLGFAALFKERGPQQKKLIRRFVNGLLLVVVLLSVAIGVRSTVDRFSSDRLLREGRAAIWSETVRWIGQFPVFGTGLGTFATLVPGTEVEGTLIAYEHAHNEYLEYLMEAGVVGTVLLLGLIVLMLGRSLAAWRSRSDPEIRGLALGGLVSCLGVLIHGITDFNTRIPANAMLFAVILSATMALAFLKRSRGGAVDP